MTLECAKDVNLALVDSAFLDPCEHVLRLAFGPYVRKLGRKQTAAAYSWLPVVIAEQRVYGAFDQGRLFGVAITAQEDKGWTIEQIAVHPSHQGRGIGSRLLDFIEASARDQKKPALFLDTAEIMTDLLRLYRRHGFREVRKGLPSHNKDNHVRVFMKKDLQKRDFSGMP